MILIKKAVNQNIDSCFLFWLFTKKFGYATYELGDVKEAYLPKMVYENIEHKSGDT